MSTIDTTLNNIISHYELEEASGTRVDSHGSNNLTDNNTVGQGTGLLGNCADLERGNSEYLSSTASSLKITSDFSLSLWLKIETQVTVALIEYQIYNRYLSTGNNRAFALTYIYNGGTPALQVITSANGSSITFGSINQTFTPGTWYHLVAVYDASAGSVELYVNGSSIGTITSLNTSLYAGSAPTEIGAQNGNFTFDGLIEEVTVTNDVITSGEVTTLYNSGTPLPYTSTGSTNYTQDLNETATLAETIDNEIALQRSYSEGITLADSFSSISVSLLDIADGLTLSENLAARISGRVLAETVTATDVVVKTFTKILTEAASLAVSIANTTYKALQLDENLTLVENVIYKLNGVNALWRDIYTDTTDAWSDIYNDN